MSEGQNQTSLKFEISNDTQNTTLKCYRYKGYRISRNLEPELPPGSSDSCHIFSNPETQCYEWLLVYEAESFTLAFAAYMALKSSLFPNLLHLELSLDKAHLGDFEDAFSCLVQDQNNPHADKTTVARGMFTNTMGFVTLRAGPYKVMAAMFQSGIEVKLEERRHPKDLGGECTIL